MLNIKSENNHFIFVFELFCLLITNYDDLLNFEHNLLFYFFLIVHKTKPWLSLSITTNKTIRCATIEWCTKSAHILTHFQFCLNSPWEFCWLVEDMSHVKIIRLSKECRVQVINYAKDHKAKSKKVLYAFSFKVFMLFSIMFYISDCF